MEYIRREYAGQVAAQLCGFLLLGLLLCIGGFLLVKGSLLFTEYDHSLSEFLFSPVFKPADTLDGGGQTGAAVFIAGSLITCAMALAITLPFSIASAIAISVIAPEQLRGLLRSAIEIFAGIPSVVYGWVGLVVLVPAIQTLFKQSHGQSVLAASIVLAVMIFPTITSVTADALANVSPSYVQGAYGLGATRWQTIYKIIIPAAFPGIVTAVILGLARAFGEALAVAMVIGKMKAIPGSILQPAHMLTAAIASYMGGAMEGGEYNAALWTMALFLFAASLICILCVHRLSGMQGKEA